MKIILKFVFRNIKEKKMRTFLIIFSVALSSALLFASLSIGGTLGNMYLEQIRTQFGSADLIVHPTAKSPSRNISPTKAYDSSVAKEIQYVVGEYASGGLYKPDQDTSIQVNLRGFEQDDLEKLNPITLIQAMPDAFVGNKVIINKVASDKYGLKVGDSLDIEIEGVKHRFIIHGIAVPKGPFREDGRTFTCIAPKEAVSTLFDSKGKSNMVYIKLLEGKDPVDISGAIESLEQVYPRFEVREPVTEEEIQQFLNQITMPFLMMTFVVLFMSVFIIYTSFKVITMERLPIIGTFRSIGATRKTTDFVLIFESLLYGVIGGISGVFLGILILYGMSYAMAKDPYSGIVMEINLNYELFQVVAAVGLGVALALFSSILPILKISKIPVKEIVLGQLETIKSRKIPKTPIGILLLGTSLILPMVTPFHLLVPVGGACLIFSSVAMTLLVPQMTMMLTKWMEPLFKLIFGNIGILASRNIRDNKSILNNISLLAIGISSIIMINTMSTSVTIEVGKFYKDSKFEIWMWIPQADRTAILPVLSTTGVTDAYGVYTQNDVKIINKNKTISLLHGIDITKQNDYWNMEIPLETLKKVDSGKAILVTDVQKASLGLEVGDTITLQTPKGETSYEVAGFFDSLMYNGSYGMISAKNMKADFGTKYFDDIFVRVDSNEKPDEVMKVLMKKLSRKDPWMDTITSMEEKNRISNDQMFTILKGFSGLAMVIGVFGVLNNLMISFIQRQRHMAIFRSIGMSKRQLIKMTFAESVASGLIGGLSGAFAGMVLLIIIPYVLPAMVAPIKMHYDPWLFIEAVIAGVIITVLASVSPALKSSKMNIIESIKYE